MDQPKLLSSNVREDDVDESTAWRVTSRQMPVCEGAFLTMSSCPSVVHLPRERSKAVWNPEKGWSQGAPASSKKGIGVL